MTVSDAVAADIRRLHKAEHWKVGTIATQLGIHADVVRRVLGLLAPTDSTHVMQPMLLDGHIAFVAAELQKYPNLRATRLYDMLRERGYEGSVRTVRRHVATVRPTNRGKAHFRLQPLIAEQAQVDWAHVGTVDVSGCKRALWLFVMVLSYSRALWGEFVLDLTAASLRRSLIRAGQYFGGNTRQWLFDNPKIVVLERHGTAIRFHPELIDLTGQFCVQARVCGVRQPQHKGRVERAVRYVRDRLLAGQEISSVAQGNSKMERFLEEVALSRPHPEVPNQTVGDVLVVEQKHLLPLPEPLPSLQQAHPGQSDKCAFVRFDKNSYSVPPNYHSQAVTLAVDDVTVRILDAQNHEIARHVRCWGQRQRIQDAAHRAQLLAERHTARVECGGHARLRGLVPRMDELFARWVENGRNVGSMTSRVLTLLDSYGDAVFVEAAHELLDASIHDPGALALLCEKHRQRRGQRAICDAQLPNHQRDCEVVQHSLESYDA
jgi:transposase